MGGSESSPFKSYGRKLPKNVAHNVKAMGENGRVHRAEGKNRNYTRKKTYSHFGHVRFPILSHTKCCKKRAIFSAHFCSYLSNGVDLEPPIRDLGPPQQNLSIKVCIVKNGSNWICHIHPIQRQSIQAPCMRAIQAPV